MRSICHVAPRLYRPCGVVDADIHGLHEASPDPGVLAELPQSALSCPIAHASPTETIYLYSAERRDGAPPSRKRLDPTIDTHVPGHKAPDVLPGRSLPSRNLDQSHV